MSLARDFEAVVEERARELATQFAAEEAAKREAAEAEVRGLKEALAGAESDYEIESQKRQGAERALSEERAGRKEAERRAASAEAAAARAAAKNEMHEREMASLCAAHAREMDLQEQKNRVLRDGNAAVERRQKEMTAAMAKMSQPEMKMEFKPAEYTAVVMERDPNGRALKVALKPK